MKVEKFSFPCAILVTILASMNMSQAQGVKTGLVSTPTIECLDETSHTITLRIRAGSTGLPGGFSVQWMTQEDFLNGTPVNAPGEWPADSGAAAEEGVLCKASFSGNAHATNWNVPSGGQRDITIGALGGLIDNSEAPGGGPSGGVSSNCRAGLECGTTYVFRVFGHATKTLKRSEFSQTVTCSTAPCEPGHPVHACSFTQGGWGSSCPVSQPSDQPGCIRNAHFETVYPGGLTLGGHYTMSFSTPGAVQAYLPAGGSPSVLDRNHLNPTATSAGVFGGQVTALRLNVDYSDGGVLPHGLGDQWLCQLTNGSIAGGALALGGSVLTASQVAALQGISVADILAAAEFRLGGPASPPSSVPAVPFGLSRGQLNELVTLLNEAYNGKLFDEAGNQVAACGAPSGFARDFLCR